MSSNFGQLILEGAPDDETKRIECPRAYRASVPSGERGSPTGSYLQFRHVIHVGGSLGLRGRIRGGSFVLQLAEGVLHRRQRIDDERERGRLTLRLLAAPSLALVQRQIPHAVIGGAAVIVVGELLERRPG